jgi:cysteinyl-tRNA synthetase
MLENKGSNAFEDKSSMGFWKDITRDYHAVFERDPAARNAVEVLLTYPGLYAIFVHRISHSLWNLHVPVLPRFLSNVSRFFTGIEIHPAAKIGGGFFIDHGMGVVIGETTEIGNDCLLYQGVTLGGTGKEKGKRHPTLGNNVVVGAGAKILGPMRIGDYVKIGANSVVLKPVPDYAIVVGVPGRIIKKKVVRIEAEGLVEALDHVKFPDPVDEKLLEFAEQIEKIEARIDKMEGKRAGIKIFNTMTGKKEDFIPLERDKVGIYACGVTVYDYSHIGHARSAVVFDIISRYLRHKGFAVKYVRNFTDIDDKIIKRANEDGTTWDKVAQKYIAGYWEDMDRLGVSRADLEPRATDHIQEMIEVINALIDNGHAYVSEGSVYFAVDTFPEYGKLSGKEQKDLLAGARVNIEEKKRNPSDFALWKASKENEPWWESPWGKGRPGWHIECTAMAIRHLGESIDVHGGGADLIFPHHDNEIAQSEAFTGKPFAKYWVHNGFITIDKEKMSKSIGNFFTIREILDKFDPEVIRLFLLSSHYRSPIEFSNEQLRDGESSLDRCYSTISRINEFLSGAQVPELKAHKAVAEISDELAAVLDSFKDRFEEAMDDDFNTALALGHVFELIRVINKFLDAKPVGKDARILIERAQASLHLTSSVLNLFHRTPAKWNIDLLTIKKIPFTEVGIEQKIEARQLARENKDWALADSIRKELEEKGILLEDKKHGTGWKVKIA